MEVGQKVKERGQVEMWNGGLCAGDRASQSGVTLAPSSGG